MAGSESAASAEGPLTRRLRRLDPTWWWLRENFKLPSVSALAGVILAAGTWIWQQHSELVELGRKIDKLATSAEVAALDSHVDVLEAELGDQGDRLSRVEANWDRVQGVADEPPHPRVRRRWGLPNGRSANPPGR
jgi:hypothetical protein